MNTQLKEELPFVTIITSSYNQASFIEETIESVLSQDYPNIEYLILDDSSTDETQEILAGYGDKIRWEVMSEKTLQTPTVNRGWRMTKGEIITWLNSDDTFYPGAVSKAVDYLRNHPETGIVFGDSMHTEEDGTELYPTPTVSDFSFRKYVLNCENVITQPSTFLRRDVIRKIGYLDESYDLLMDWNFWLRAGLHFKIDYIPELLSTYRLHNDSKTVSQSVKYPPELERMYKEFFSYDDLSEELKEIESEAMMNMYFTSGTFYHIGEDAENASKMADKAFKIYPRGILNPKYVHKYLYCKLSDTSFYKRTRDLMKRGKTAKIAE